MKIIRILDKRAEEMGAVIALALMVVLVFIQVVFRYVLNSSLSWSEELARFLHIWMIWLAASYAVRKNEHIRVEIVKNLFSTKWRKVIDFVAILLWLGFAVFFATQGFEMVMTVLERGQKAAATRIPMWIVYTAIPLGGSLMSIRLIQRIYLLFRPNKEVEIK